MNKRWAIAFAVSATLALLILFGLSRTAKAAGGPRVEVLTQQSLSQDRFVTILHDREAGQELICYETQRASDVREKETCISSGCPNIIALSTARAVAVSCVPTGRSWVSK